MLLDLREVRGAEDRVDRTYSADSFSCDLTDEYVVSGDVVLALRVLKDGNMYRFIGPLQSTLRLPCCRCLDVFDILINVAIDLRYLPKSANQGNTEAEISEDDLSTAFYQHDQIDVEQMVREQFQLALPMKPLCREGCGGLCPVCGVNLNIERCSCKARWHDPRLAVLETLFPDRPRH